MSNPAIEEAYTKAGGRRKVKESLGVSKQSLSDWARNGRVPADKAGKLEAISGVSRRKLCPDFDWGPIKSPA
jgi:DNA-binding transcriptional regulator YdaS (Cro superfamily)